MLVVKVTQVSQFGWMAFRAPQYSHVLLVAAIVHHLRIVATTEMSPLNAVSIYFCDSQLYLYVNLVAGAGLIRRA